MDFRKRHNISVDVVLFGFDEDAISVLLNKRYLNLYSLQYPIIDDWKLVGGQVFKSERLDEAALRLIRQVGCKNKPFFHQFRTFGNPERITKRKDVVWSESKQVDSNIVSVAYYGLTYCSNFEIEDESYEWFPLDNLPELGLDHLSILNFAYKYLKEKVNVVPVIYNLLPAKFTLNSLQKAYEIVFGTCIDNRNFRKKITSKPYIVRLDEKVRLYSSKKPANLYMFSSDVYDKMITEKPMIIL